MAHVVKIVDLIPAQAISAKREDRGEHKDEGPLPL